MKYFLLALTLFFLQIPTLIYSDSLSASEELTSNPEGNGETLDASCYAWADCWNGQRIYCYSYGPACTWNYVPGHSVTCCEGGYWGRCNTFTCF